MAKQGGGPGTPGGGPGDFRRPQRILLEWNHRRLRRKSRSSRSKVCTVRYACQEEDKEKGTWHIVALLPIISFPGLSYPAWISLASPGLTCQTSPVLPDLASTSSTTTESRPSPLALASAVNTVTPLLAWSHPPCQPLLLQPLPSLTSQKSRALYGMEANDKWCKPCKGKKKASAATRQPPRLQRRGLDQSPKSRSL